MRSLALESSSTLISFSLPAEEEDWRRGANQEARGHAIFVSISPGSLTMRNEDAHSSKG